jgi:heme-degrading monooxygenase HmoA
MHVIVWKFLVRPGKEGEFEEAYGSQGAWARLFARSGGYQGTELLADSQRRGRYFTIDRWSSAQVFADFRAAFGQEYHQLAALCEGLTEGEARLGVFESEG